MIIVEFSYISININEIMLIRRVFIWNERILQKSVCPAKRDINR